MTSRTPDIQAVLERLEKLERKNRRLKQSGIVALLVLCAVVLMGQAGPSRTIEATRFVLKDGEGRVRAELNLDEGFPKVILRDKKGLPQVGLGGDDEPYLALTNTKNFGAVALKFYQGSPALELSNNKGFATVIGGTDLTTARTGESHRTSAASIVMVGQDGNIIWRAP
jgi:hypothetical protein